MGLFFGADGDLARQRRLKRRHPRNPLTNLDPSWEPKATKNDQKSMPRCVQILHWFSDRFLIDFGIHLGTILEPCWASCWGSATLQKSSKTYRFSLNFHGLGSPSWGNFLMFLGCLFQDRFLIVLGSVLGSIWGPFWHYNRTQIEEKTGLILGSIFGASLGKNEKLFPGRGGPGGPLIRSKDFLSKKQEKET